MNIQHAMKIGPAKVNELFAKLADTSGGAVKNRETIFAELTSELDQMIELEEKHLLPLLAKHNETRELVPAVREGNKNIRVQVKELGQAQKNDDAFSRGLATLRKSFQQSVRDDRNELLPAIQKVLSCADTEQAVAKIEAPVAEAQQARRDEAIQAQADANAAREQMRNKAEADQAAERAREAADETARQITRQATASLKEAGDTARNASRGVATRLADNAQRVTASMDEAAGMYRKAAAGTAGDLQAMASVSSVAVRGLTEVRQLWNERMSAAVQQGATLSQRLMQCKSSRDVAEAQHDYIVSATRNWLSSQVKLLQATQRMTADALPALQARLAVDPGQKEAGRTAG